MVDFNDGNTVGTPAADIVRVLVLEARKYAFDAWEDYYKKRLQGMSAPLATVKARLFNLFMNLRSALKRRWGEKDIKFIELEELVKSDKKEDLIKAYYIIDDYLDNTKLIRLDTQEVHDKTNIEADNRSR